MKLTGTNSNPFDAWMVYTGMKTLKLRMDVHSRNALELAQFLVQQDSVGAVHYPGLPDHPDHHIALKQMRAFGGMMSFELNGGVEAGIKMMNKLRFCSLAPTLGDVGHVGASPRFHESPENSERRSFGKWYY